MPAANVPAIVLIYDIRGFTAASKRLKTADLGAFATGAHRAILDLFAARPPTFVKNLGDGHLLLWETGERPDPDLLAAVVEGAGKARAAFAAFVQGHGAEGQTLPQQVGLGVAFGEVSKSDDYYGVALNLAARLQNLARPYGMAVDRTVFDEVARRDETFRAEFKRARVRLKGLGSTVVWVKRPFSWLRVAIAARPYLAAFVALFGYVGLASAGVPVPGEPAIQRFLDGHGWTLFRPVRSEAEVRAAALTTRRDLTASLLRTQTPEGWMLADLKDVPREPGAREQKKPDIWASSQTICALLKSPETSIEDARRVVRGLEYAYQPGVFIEVGGVAYGWLAHEKTKYTEAEAALWTVAATAVALGRPGLLEGERRDALLARLADAQRAADTYRPSVSGTWDGGWNMFPNQEDLGRRSPYTATLALLALLETRAAGLPWQGSFETRDAALAGTVGWFLAKFGTYDGLTGWRRTWYESDPVSIGLTLQIHSELLRAEAEAGITIPAAVERALVRQLVSLPREVQYDAGENNEVPFRMHTGVDVTQSESINFLIDPWAIEAALRWLARAKEKGADPADETAVRRTLGRLVVDNASAKRLEATTGWTFIGAETLYVLSSIPRP
jgi:class 3 adenylate cyclase